MLETTAPTKPTMMLWGIPTNPAAGVIATRPTTAPIQNPSTEGFFPLITSKNIQVRPADAAAVVVVPNALTAKEVAPTAEPALKPNQPNHNSPVPINTYGTFAGGISLFSTCDFLLFKTMAPANAAQPAVICTTVPPAKSQAPILARNPSGCQFQCATGAYTNKENKTIKEVNRILSANAPTTRPGVMIANINWNKENNVSGIVFANGQAA